MSADEDTELRDLVAQTLDKNGVLNKIRAELRANVFLALDEQDSIKKNTVENKKLKGYLQTKDGQQAFELVREFLKFFHLDFTLAVLEPEAGGVESKTVSREALCSELNIQSDGKTPLLNDLLKRKFSDGRSSPPSPKSRIPKKVEKSAIDNRKEDNKENLVSDVNLDDSDELFKDLGVSPLQYNVNNTKSRPSWMEGDLQEVDTKKTALASLKNAPPLNKKSLEDMNSPEWDDLMKPTINTQNLAFDNSTKTDKSNKSREKEVSNKDFQYDEDFHGSSSQKSGISISEELEDDLSIGSFAESKADDLTTEDQTVSQMSGGASRFDYGEDAEEF